MKSFAKKFLGIALAAVLLLGVLPMAAFAAGTHTATFKVNGASFIVPTNDEEKIDTSSQEYLDARAAAEALVGTEGRVKFLNWKFARKGGADIDLSSWVLTDDKANVVPVYEIKAVCEHTETIEVVTKEATCTEKGTKEIRCKACNELISTEEIAPKGHTYVKKTLAPTCMAEGAEWEECSVCNAEKPDSRKVLPKSDHTWGDWVVTKEATASSEGSEKRTCTVCGAEESRAIPKSENPIYVWKLTLDENKPSEFNNSAVTTYEIKDGQRVGSLFAKGMPIPAANLYVFRGWYLCNPDGSETNIKVTSETVYDYGRNVTLKAKWAREARVNLMIYRNGNTKTPYDVVPLYGYAVGDVIYTKDLNIKSYYNNGGKPFDFDGWYDRAGWTLYKAQDNPKPASAVETVDLNGDTTLFCMIRDSNAPSSNKNPDRTNPKTGDESMIIATTAVMLVSAGALAVFFMDRKRRNG